MRLHHLEMTAFGPFAGTERVDFDALSEGALFLLCGDTGAGKSTVLDGVCFALYGDVPSRRATAKQLRSQHAAPSVAPRVVLEATIASRRFRFTRSPAWSRPKKRGTGCTVEQARVLLEEHVGDSWELRSNRMDDAGLLVGRLLGMTLAQFSQVVLLPQGQFDTFLRSTSEERQQVLTRLFDTGRFEQVERWFTERRKQLWREHDRLQSGVVEWLHRISEVAATELPESWSLDNLVEPAADGSIDRWIEEVIDRARTTRAAAGDRLDRARSARAAASRELEVGREVSELLDRRLAAIEARDRLVQGADRVLELRARLAAARRAAPVVPFVVIAREAAQAAAAAKSQADRAVLGLARLVGGEPDVLGVPDELERRERAVTQHVAAARAFRPRAVQLEAARRQRAANEARIDELVQQIAACEATLSEHPARRCALVRELTALRAEAATAPRLETERQALDGRRAAAELADVLDREVKAARVAEAEQEQELLASKEVWLTVREQRLAGMAAELAAAMAVGAGCPVCGSTEHPAPARIAADAPRAEDEQHALKRVDDAQARLEVHRDRVRGLENRLVQARSGAGGASHEALSAELEQVLAALDRAQQADAAVEGVQRSLAALDADTAEQERRLAEARAQLEGARDKRDTLADAVAGLAEELAELLRSDDDSLQDLIADQERLRTELLRTREALLERARREEQADLARRRLDGAASSAGFADSAAALDAHVDAEELADLEGRLREHERLEAEVELVLADPAVRTLGDREAPDVPALQAAYAAVDLAHTDAAGLLRIAERTLRRLDEHRADLERALSSWAPVREEQLRVRALAELVEGKGPDNTRQMRLSAYVLASRLSQVVAAANERLARMVDDRYLLEHTADRGAGDRRGGLSLLVRDQWTDEVRDPVTLSGGETFVVSLALALGLADVVAAESGGISIETLFVDEGFGSLDGGTLELVMDTLDQLREGGRTVGVVSHVAEMKSRIPTQLEVLKGRTGSTLRQGPSAAAGFRPDVTSDVTV